ncbi:MAG: Crp/Fnr family transcriptional regulator [Thermomicrobiales bacterium]
MVLNRFSRRKPPVPDTSSSSLKSILLREAEVFKDIAPADMKEIERMTTMITTPKGRVLLTPERQQEVLFILKKGRAQVFRETEDGRRLVISILEHGAIFGEMPLLSQKLGGSSVETLDDCTLCVMSRSDVERLITTNAHFALNVVHLLAERNAVLESKLEQQTFQSAPEGVASALLELADPAGQIKDVSHQQLGESIGASRETVTRILGDFKLSGLIDISRSSIVIKDRAGLELTTRRPR